MYVCYNKIGDKMLKDKVVLVTGGAKGIGAATIKRFAKEQCKVVINYNTSKKEAYELQEEVKKAGISSLVIKADITKQDEVDEMINKIVTEFKRIDILINNASIAIDTLFHDKAVDNFKKTLDTNLIAPFYLSQKIGELMYEQKEGAIINVSSTNGIDKYYPMSLDYDASKAALISLTHNLSFQFAPFVRVNSVAPGFIATENEIKDLDEEFIKSEEEKIFVKRLGESSEVANVIVFLASDEASYINNTVIRVDGGTY